MGGDPFVLLQMHWLPVCDSCSRVFPQCSVVTKDFTCRATFKALVSTGICSCFVSLSAAPELKRVVGRVSALIVLVFSVVISA